MIHSLCSPPHVLSAWRCLVFLGALAIIMADAIHATTIYAPTSASQIAVQVSKLPFVKQATRFTTTATDYIVTGVAFEMRAVSDDLPTGFLNWLIYTDAGNLPGLPSPGIIFNQDVSTLTTSYATVSTGALSVTLAPSTNYWLVLNGESLDSGSLEVPEALSPISGTGGPFRGASDTNGAGWGGVDNIALVGTITAVPEPGTLALGAIGAGIAALVAWRHQSGRAARHSASVLSD